MFFNNLCLLLVYLAVLDAPLYSSSPTIEELEKGVTQLAISKQNLQHDLSKESKEKKILQELFAKPYSRELVTRVVKKWPPPKAFLEKSGITQSTISKLQSPELYGELQPSAQKLWKWLQEKGIEEIQKEGKNLIYSLGNSLKNLDLSNAGIVHDDIENVKPTLIPSIDKTDTHTVSQLIEYLQKLRGTFTSLNLQNNLLADEGVRKLVKELENHRFLEELNLASNKITDEGLQSLIHLIEKGVLKKLNIKNNFGPSDSTVQKLKDADPKDIKIRVIF